MWTGEGDGLKASQSPSQRKRRQTEATYYPTIAEKRKSGEGEAKSRMMGKGGKAAGGFGRRGGEEGVGGCGGFRTKPTSSPSLLEQRSGKAKEGIGSWRRRMDGWMEAKRDAQGKQRGS
jgi:hypothetical protein